MSEVIVSQAPPDGYTLLYITDGLWIAPLLREALYDVFKVFAPITLAARAPSVLVVHPSVPVTSVKELIALAKAKPGELNYASGASGGGAHLATELFKAMAGVNVVRISYKSAAPAMNDVLGGQVQMYFASPIVSQPHIKSGKLRALAVTSAQPFALFPGLPTVAASGLPGYESVTHSGIFAPAKTPVTIIKRLNHEIVRAINRAEVKEKFFNIGAETVGSSPEQFAGIIKSEIVVLGKLIRDIGIKAD